MVKIGKTPSYWGEHSQDVTYAANLFNMCPLWTIEYWSSQPVNPDFGNELCTFILYLLHS